MRLIGENPHPLVSARFPLRNFSSRNFAQDYHIHNLQDLGFPEFTRCFNPDYSGKLQYVTAACSTIELSRNGAFYVAYVKEEPGEAIPGWSKYIAIWLQSQQKI